MTRHSNSLRSSSPYPRNTDIGMFHSCQCPRLSRNRSRRPNELPWRSLVFDEEWPAHPIRQELGWRFLLPFTPGVMVIDAGAVIALALLPPAEIAPPTRTLVHRRWALCLSPSPARRTPRSWDRPPSPGDYHRRVAPVAPALMMSAFASRLMTSPPVLGAGACTNRSSR
jgi:hypothetical protein